MVVDFAFQSCNDKLGPSRQDHPTSRMSGGRGRHIDRLLGRSVVVIIVSGLLLSFQDGILASVSSRTTCTMFVQHSSLAKLDDLKFE